MRAHIISLKFHSQRTTMLRVDSFWLLSTIVEDLCAGFFSKSMIGVQVFLLSPLPLSSLLSCFSQLLAPLTFLSLPPPPTSARTTHASRTCAWKTSWIAQAHAKTIRVSPSHNNKVVYVLVCGRSSDWGVCLCQSVTGKVVWVYGMFCMCVCQRALVAVTYREEGRKEKEERNSLVPVRSHHRLFFAFGIIFSLVARPFCSKCHYPFSSCLKRTCWQQRTQVSMLVSSLFSPLCHAHSLSSVDTWRCFLQRNCGSCLRRSVRGSLNGSWLSRFVFTPLQTASQQITNIFFRIFRNFLT